MESFLHQRVLITGGCGFIGSAVVRCLFRSTSSQIAVLDKLTYSADPASLEESRADSRLEFRQIDLLDRELVDSFIREFRPSLVLHLAAETHVDRSIDDPLRFVETNLVGTACLLEGIRKYWQTLSSENRTNFRFVHVSTDEVYGSLNGEGHFTVATPYQPNSPYAASKAGADHLVRAWWKTYGLPVIFTHSCNNYGPYQYPEKLIPLMLWKALRGEDLPIYGDGEQTREWIYVEDHAAALLMIGNRGKIGSTFHITSGESLRNIDLVKQLTDHLYRLASTFFDRSKADRLKRSAIVHVADRPGHDVRYAMSNDHLRTELGWQPKVSWNEGLLRTIQWYLDHPEFFAKQYEAGYSGDRMGCLTKS